MEIFLVFLGLLVSLVLGANNASTCFGTSVGFTRYLEAASLAVLGVLMGVILEGEKLSKAVSGGVLEEPILGGKPLLIVMISVLILMVIATLLYLPLPVSEGFIGSAIGLGLATEIGVNWIFTLRIFTFWILTPFFSAFLAVLIYKIVSWITYLAKDILTINYLYSKITLALSFYVAYVFGANTIGLISGIYRHLLGMTGFILFGSFTGLGMYLLGRGVTESVGKNIISLSPSTALVAQLSGALIVHIFTQICLPVSVTQAIIGGVLGVGLAKKIVILNKRVVKSIIAGWAVAPLFGLVISYLLAIITLF